MKNLKKLSILGMLLIGMFVFAGCGAESKASAEEVAKKFVTIGFTKDVNEEATANELKGLIHSKVSDSEKNSAVSSFKLIRTMLQTQKIQYKQMGVEDKFDEVIEKILASVEITQKDKKEDGDKIIVDFEIALPQLDQKKLEGKVEELVKEKTKDKKPTEINEKELMKEVMTEAIDIMLKDLKVGENSQRQNVQIELKKDGKGFGVTSVR